jgi:hypothetical protein
MSLVIFDGLYGEDEYVDLRTNQQVGGIKTFIDALISMAGSNAITIRPLVGQGESTMRFQRMSDGTTPQHGDSWVIGQGPWSSARNFVIGSLGGGDDKIRLTIFPDGNIDVGANGRLFPKAVTRMSYASKSTTPTPTCMTSSSESSQPYPLPSQHLS